MSDVRLLVSVVDDDQSVRESLPDVLGELGFATETFSSAREFLAWDRFPRTACLVLDIAMPGMSGPELYGELKRRGQEIPTVFITGTADKATRPRMLALGAVDCLSKPFSEAALAGAVARAVGDVRTRVHPALPLPGAPVFVVDDDVSVRESLELLIRSVGWAPQTFATAQDFLARPRLSTPACLILDVSLPDLSGLEVQRRLTDRQMEMPIVFITGHGDIPMSVQAIKAGAVEFLTKPLSDQVLLAAIANALESSRAALAEGAQVEALRTRFASLSPREQEVMTLVVSGLLNKQVGGDLGISEITVKAHRGKVMRKMKADSLADLVKMAARLRLQRAPSRGAGAPATNRQLTDDELRR
jgi:FixJ family two-component response regulator